MSQENVELVRRLQPPPDTDFVAVFRDEGDTGPLAEWFGAFFHSDCEFVGHGLSPINAIGLSDFRDAWRDWLAPWAGYRTKIDDLMDLGDRVVVLVHDYGRRSPDAPEVDVISAAVWIVREGKVARVEFYTGRDEALKAAGVKE